MKILLLEDDKLFNETIEDFLEEEGFTVKTALDPYSALDFAFEEKFDLYLFDVNLPYENGFELLEKLREANDTTPTIFLTSRDDKHSILKGFRAGADDYMKKPIDLDELLLRIHVVLKRHKPNDKMSIGEYVIDTNAKQLYLDDDLLPLTQKAVELLFILRIANEEIVTLETIEEKLWHVNEERSAGAIRVYITKLKKYFPMLENIRGVGYRLPILT